METSIFDEHHVIHELKHYLPAQAPLKDFVHHNTLHAFQNKPFFEAIREAATVFGYKVSLSPEEFRKLYRQGRIREDVLRRKIAEHHAEAPNSWLQKELSEAYSPPDIPRVGTLRIHWKKIWHIDLDAVVHPLLFRVLCSYLDQGISVWDFPVQKKSFLAALRKVERYSPVSFFRGKRAKDLLLNTPCEISELLAMLVGDETLFADYLFDQQFAHPGWSGLVATTEERPYTLLDSKKLSLHDLIVFELLLEIDALDDLIGEGKWQPLAARLPEADRPTPLFAPVAATEKDEVLQIWQEAYEWSYYDEVIAAIQKAPMDKPRPAKKSFQALFCMDDREGSFRTYVEMLDPHSETFGTPGFFGVDTYFQPEGGKFYQKVCPAPVHPKHIIKEYDSHRQKQKDAHFSKSAQSAHGGFVISQTLGFWSAVKLFMQIFVPSMSPATASSLKHMDRTAKLTVEHTGEFLHEQHRELQVGYTVAEMATRVEGVLKSIGLVQNFAPLIYVVGHGASSVNNPHYSAYNCGACSGRAGSANARAFAYMANHAEVRELLRQRGIDIPETTWFLGALRDTTRDETVFYDEDALSMEQLELHNKVEVVFSRASEFHAKERSRRFESIYTGLAPEKIHKKIQRRSVSLFEPRPELNHATNAMCIVGRRELTDHLFLDRRSFLNSYDYRIDPNGDFLLGILNAAAPVTGGINLEYYFSRVDNQKLGAGSKLPHNVMGLFGVANGIDGDLRPGLPSQMIEVHDPVRLLMVVEHYPEVVLQTIQRNPATYEWFINEWVNHVVIHPETRQAFLFKKGEFVPYQVLTQTVPTVTDFAPLIESTSENIPVHLIKKQ